MNDNGKSPMTKLCGLWKAQGRDGAIYYSGKFTFGTRLMIFKNQYKKTERDPDLVVYMAKAEEQKAKAESFPERQEKPDPEIPF